MTQTAVPGYPLDTSDAAIEAAWTVFATSEGYRPSTRKLYKGRALQFLRWLEPQGIGLLQVTPAEVDRFITSLNVASDHGRMTYRTAIRRFFDALVANGIIMDNPADEMEAGAEVPLETTQPATGEPLATLPDLKDFLALLGTTEEASEYYRPGLVAMYPIVVGGMDPSEIASFTGIPLPEVELYVGRLRNNGIWTPDGKIVVDFDDPESPEAIMNLVLIIGCAAGVFQRFPPTTPENNDQGTNPTPGPDAAGEGSL